MNKTCSIILLVALTACGTKKHMIQQSEEWAKEEMMSLEVLELDMLLSIPSSRVAFEISTTNKINGTDTIVSGQATMLVSYKEGEVSQVECICDSVEKEFKILQRKYQKIITENGKSKRDVVKEVSRGTWLDYVCISLFLLVVIVLIVFNIAKKLRML
jgi:hypothetical protein